MTSRTFAFRACRGSSGERFLALLHPADPPTQEEWRDYVNLVQATIADAPSLVHAFVATDGGSPNAMQRRLLADAVARGSRGMETHVFTTDVFIRSVVTAFSWISRPGASAYPPREFAEVCRKCGQSPDVVVRELRLLQESLPHVHMLERIVRAMEVREPE